MRLLCLLLATTLAACTTTEERVAQLNARDDTSCRAQGVPGSAAYQQCRQNLMTYRAQAERSERERWDALSRAGKALRDEPEETTVIIRR